MAMNLGSARSDEAVMVDMNTTPLIDVLLVMLVMLIITIPIQTHGVKLDLPVNTPLRDIPPPVVNLVVEFDGTITWNGAPVSLQQLDSYFISEARKGNDLDEIHVNPDRLAKYDVVAIIMADAQRRGVTRIGIGNTGDYVK